MVALEFLTLSVGTLVLDDVCNPLRSFARNDGETPVGVSVDRYFDRGYEPRHALYWMHSDDSLEFHARLFGAIVFRVTIDLFRLRGPTAAYVEELETGMSLLSQDGLGGRFYVMNPKVAGSSPT